ncbi:MAG TPA: hypothetical protein VGZ93_12015 [Candidatus Methylacidiphilales bacterium]|jgi:hypothetical protein|nr:hypothetical protein [Candidatus Methylacidiphilales bacterium]
MIYQIATVKTKTEPLPTINRDLLKARHIQFLVKEKVADRALPTEVFIRNPMNGGHYVVPITRWIE